MANLSNDTQAFEGAMQGKKLDFFYLTTSGKQASDKELGYFQELQARLKTLTLLQIAAVHRNLNVPDRDTYEELVEQTRDSLFEIALTLGEESTIRILAKQLFDRTESDSSKKALLLRLQRLYPKSERVAETILEMFSRKHFNCGDPLNLLEEFYGGGSDFNKLIVTEVLSNFESFLPRGFNDLDQAMLLRFLAKKMGLEHEDEIY